MTASANILLSASQISVFTECQRKWGFKYLEKIEVPQHPSAALGTEVHEHQLGPYLIEGRGFDFTRPSGEIANALTALLPASKTPGLRVERRFEIPSPRGGFGYLGFIDLWAPDSGVVPGLEGGRPLLGDFKTTSNLAYAKTPETLATDIQAQLYATALMFEDGVDELDLVWFYVRTRRPHRAQRVHLRVNGSHVVEQFQRIDEIGSQVVAIRLAQPTTDELPPNARMCEAYGGCPYRHKCNLAPSVFATAVNMEAVTMNSAKTTDFLAGLRKQASPAPPAPAPAPVAPAAVPSDAQVPAPAGLPAWATAPVDPLHRAAINPPESALPPAPPVTSAPAPAAAAPPAEAPKRRGRPPKTAGTTAPVASDADPIEGFPRAEAAAFLRALAVWLEGGVS